MALQSAVYLKKKSGKSAKALFAGITLTSLVDVFTILVVYLLVATSLGIEELKTVDGMSLPTVSHSDALGTGLSLQILNGKYYFDDQEVKIDQLVTVLKNARKEQAAIILQADKRAQFLDLNPAVLSGLQAGFTKISFAVLQEESK